MPKRKGTRSYRQMLKSYVDVHDSGASSFVASTHTGIDPVLKHRLLSFKRNQRTFSLPGAI